MLLEPLAAYRSVELSKVRLRLISRVLEDLIGKGECVIDTTLDALLVIRSETILEWYEFDFC